MYKLVLYRPQMPENVGNIIRISANFGLPLHIIGPLDFFLDKKKMPRSTLDYYEIADVTYHTSFNAFLEKEQPKRIVAATIHGKVRPSDFSFTQDDYLIFGRETSGLPDNVMDLIKEENRLCIPMVKESRCLNVSNAVAVLAYEA